MSLSMIFCRGVRWQPSRSVAAPLIHKFTCVANCTKYNINIQRLMSMEAKPPNDAETSTPEFGPKENFVTIYQYPLINHVSLVHSCKGSFSNVMLFILTISTGLSYSGLITYNITCAIALVGLLLGIPLHIFARYSQKMVGYIYSSTDGATVQIAYVDSSGRRKDEVFPASDIIPLLDSPSSFTDRFYTRILRYSKPNTDDFKLDTYHGIVTDKKRFEKVFGMVPLR